MALPQWVGPVDQQADTSAGVGLLLSRPAAVMPAEVVVANTEMELLPARPSPKSGFGPRTKGCGVYLTGGGVTELGI